MGRSTPRPQDSTLRENPVMWITPQFPTPHQAYMYKRGEPFTPYASTIMADYASGVNMYSVFLHGDQPLTEIQTENKNGRKAVVVKESFGNAFSPFLVAHYETVYIVDQRYFELNLLDFIKQNGVTGPDLHQQCLCCQYGGTDPVDSGADDPAVGSAGPGGN